MKGCDEIRPFDAALSDSSAILLGELVEMRNVVIDTTHHGEKIYLKGKFKVSRSWKTVDRELVWISLPDQATSCLKFKEGEVYLIYASQLGTDFFVDAHSRAVSADSTLAVEDIGRLGASQIALSQGEFSLKPSPLVDLVLAFSIAVVISVIVLVWFRKNTK